MARHCQKECNLCTSGEYFAFVFRLNTSKKEEVAWDEWTWWTSILPKWQECCLLWQTNKQTNKQSKTDTNTEQIFSFLLCCLLTFLDSHWTIIGLFSGCFRTIIVLVSTYCRAIVELLSGFCQTIVGPLLKVLSMYLRAVVRPLSNYVELLSNYCRACVVLLSDQCWR